jgi:iron complex transport system substrate-binding protein
VSAVRRAVNRRVLAFVAALWFALGTAIAAAAPLRIVSLAPNLTELLFAAGAGEQVVGASEFSDWPPPARDLPRIGDAFRLDYEGILALRPDVAVAWQTGTPAEAIARLEQAGIPVVVVPVQSLEEIAAGIETLGRLAGTEGVAAAAAGGFRSDVERLRARHAGRPVLEVFIELDHRPLFTVTGRHLISEMVSVCGGRNVFASLRGLAPSVDLEAVIAARPDVILYTGPEPDPAALWRDWPDLPAVRDHNVIRVPGDLVSRATPRVVAGIETICGALDGARARSRTDALIPRR